MRGEQNRNFSDARFPSAGRIGTWDWRTRAVGRIGHKTMSAAGILPAARTHALREALEHFGKAAQQAQKPQLQVVYATRNDWNRTDSAQHMAVLDASFNPPTRAHLALARLPRSATQPAINYDAHILIFSVRNADKGRGRPGDATALQRLEMIELLAKQLERDLPDPNVVVALVDEPLVFSKSTLIHAALGTQAPLYLYWLMGSDTITRVFQVKYYESEKHLEQVCTQFFGQQRSKIVCAERSVDSVQGHAGHPSWSGTQSESDEVNMLLQQPGPAHEWYSKGAIELRKLDPDAARHSSTAVRRFLENSPRTPHVHEELAQLVPSTLVDYLFTQPIYGPTE